VTLEDKREYKEKLLRSIQVHYPFIKKLDKKSDYYIYFYFHGLSLLNDKGTFCFITSNSWLDVGYGKDLQEFLLKYCHIKAIYDNEAKRSFEHADVNTIIALFGQPQILKSGNAWPALNEITRFVMFKRPFEESVNTKNLLVIEKAEAVHKADSYRVYPVKQETLLEEGWEQLEDERQESEEEEIAAPSARNDKVLSTILGKERASSVIARNKATKQSQPLLKEKFITGKYEGNKWGGKYLRAPDIYWQLIEPNKTRLVSLSAVCAYQYGLKPGNVDFFYLSEKTIKEYKIPERYTYPILTSTQGIRNFFVTAGDCEKMFYCLDPAQKIKAEGVYSYIKDGEKKKIHQITSVKSHRPFWYSIRPNDPDVVLLQFFDQRFWTLLCKDNIACSNNFYYGKLTIDKSIGMVLLNSIFYFLQIEMLGRVNMAQGVLTIYGEDFRFILLPKPDLLDKKTCENVLRKLFSREVKSIFDELGLNPARPIREQKPNPLPDRKALDDIVFDILGLTEDERNEVYWAVCELVKNRLEKARSV